jgi:prephenate dehydratase
MNGHRLDPLVAAALDRIRHKTGFFKVFGSYPRWHGNGS